MIDVDGARAGLLRYKLEPKQISLMHAEIDPAMEGRGLGSRLIAFALEDARERGLAVLFVLPVREVLHRAPRRVPWGSFPSQVAAGWGL